MIRRVGLRNWRAYEALDLTFGRGVTFVVAPNGVGKTSLVEGARFAAFGDVGGSGRMDEAIRAGAPSATATVEIELPNGQLLTIIRELPRKLTRNRRPPVTGLLESKQLDERDIEALLRDSYSADPAFLSRLAILRSDAFQSSMDLNLRDHLCDYFGIGSLQNTATALDAWLKRAERDIRVTKQVNPVGPRRLKELRAMIERADATVKAARSEHEAAAQTAAEFAEEHRVAIAYTKWRAQQAERQTELQARLADMQELGIQVGEPELSEALDRAEADLTADLDSARLEQSQADGRAAAIAAALEELDGADAACPVCRRPLSEEDATTARVGHQQDLDTLTTTSAAAAARAQQLQQRLVRIRQLRQQVHRLIAAGDPEPPAPAAPVEELAAALETAEAAQQLALEQLIDARAAAAAAQRDLDAAQHDTEADVLLRRQFAAYATAEATRNALRRTTDTLLRDTIDPLTTEVAARWKRLFPDRSPVQLDADGQLTRMVEGQSLPFSAFSGGEQVAAQLLLRLLVLQTATRAEFCWIDEPLEHLDPATRRHVVSLAVRLAATTPIAQIVMTTYEEPLAWRISRRAPDLVHLTYVRPQASA